MNNEKGYKYTVEKVQLVPELVHQEQRRTKPPKVKEGTIVIGTTLDMSEKSQRFSIEGCLL
jgi:hypothetical protein